MKKKEKIISVLAILFVMAFLANYALVLLTNTQKIVGIFDLIAITDENGNIELAGAAYEDDLLTVASNDEVQIIFDESGNFLILNLKDDLTGTYEIERTIFWSDSVVITLIFNDETEIYATLSSSNDLIDLAIEDEILTFAYDSNIYAFKK
ncbi:MAG: hypothetical protein R3Y27_03520 [Clostridia bacterium]